MELAGAERVELVVPFGTRELENPVYLKALCKKLLDLGVRATIRSRDDRVTRLAGFAGFRVDEESPGTLDFATSDAARNPGSYRAFQDALTERRTQARLWQGMGIAVIGLALFVMFVGGLIFLPSATVVVRPQSETIEKVVAVNATTLSNRIDIGSLTFPAFPLETNIDVNLSVVIPQEPTEPGKKATGEVIFTNRVTEPVIVPAGTRLATNTGLQFLVRSLVALPGERGATTKAIVEAVEIGPAANVGPFAITDILAPDLAVRITVMNEAAMKDGSDPVKRLITEADYFALRQQALARAQGDAGERLRRLLPPNASFYDDGIRLRVASEAFTPTVTEQVAELSLSMVTTAHVVAFSGNDLNQMLGAHLAQQDRSLVLVPGSLKTQPLEVVSADNDSVRFHVKTGGLLQRRVDEGQITALIAGKSAKEASALLSAKYPLTKEPEILTGPFWVDSIPSFPWRVTVQQLPAS